MKESCGKIGFFTPYFQTPRGNATTARRIVHHLRKEHWHVELFPYEEKEWTPADRRRFESCNIWHALHFSRFFRFAKANLRIPIVKPYILTSGGTDVNVDFITGEDIRSWKSFLQRAAEITVFTEDARKKAIHFLGNSAPGVTVIPQAVWFPEETPKRSTESLHSARPSHLVCADERKLFRFLLPSGLRPIKDVLFLIDELKTLRQHGIQLSLTIVGKALDSKVYRDVMHVSQQNPWIRYAGDVAFENMPAFYQSCDIVLNTSISEGQSSAILEAFYFQKLVMARDNPGNRSLITDGRNGFLFRDGNEFLQKFHCWRKNLHLRRFMAIEAARTIQNNHHPVREARRYAALYKKLL